MPPHILGRLLFFSLLSVCGYGAAVILGQHAAVLIGEVEAAWISRPAAVLTLLPFMIGEVRQTPLQSRHWLGILAMGAFDVAGLVAVNASGHLPNREFAAIGISAYGATAAILAMLLLKEKAREMELKSLSLHVFGSNHVARKLYETIEHETTNMKMSKTL